MANDKIYYIGDTISLEFDLFKDKNNKIPWDLTDYQIRFELFKIKPIVSIRKATSNVSGGSDEQIKLDTSISNKFIINVNESETNKLMPGVYLFEIEIFHINTNQRVTIAFDTINLLQDKIKWNSIAD